MPSIRRQTRVHAHTHNTLNNKVVWEPWRSNIQICQREKNDNSIESQSRGVLWLWLFIWSCVVQSASEWTQISISFRIWKYLQASNHSLQSLSTTLIHWLHLNFSHPLPPHHFSFTCSLLPSHLLSRKKEHLTPVFCMVFCMVWLFVWITFGTLLTSKENIQCKSKYQ